MEDSGLPGCHTMSICKLLPMLVPLKHPSLFSNPRTLKFSATTQLRMSTVHQTSKCPFLYTWHKITP